MKWLSLFLKREIWDLFTRQKTITNPNYSLWQKTMWHFFLQTHHTFRRNVIPSTAWILPTQHLSIPLSNLEIWPGTFTAWIWPQAHSQLEYDQANLCPSLFHSLNMTRHIHSFSSVWPQAYSQLENDQVNLCPSLFHIAGISPDTFTAWIWPGLLWAERMTRPGRVCRGSSCSSCGRSGPSGAAAARKTPGSGLAQGCSRYGPVQFPGEIRNVYLLTLG